MPHAKPHANPADPDALPDLERTTVNLPWEAFRELIDLPKPEDVQPQPPRDFVVKRVAYAGKVLADHAEFTASFEVEVFAGDKWVSAPLLPMEGVALMAARLDKKDVVLASVDGFYALTLKGQGSYGVVLEFAVPLNDRDDPTGLSLQVCRVPVSVLELELARTGVEVAVDPAFGLEVESGKKLTRVLAALGAADRIEIGWREKADKPTFKLVPLVSSETTLSASFADRVLTLQAQVTLTIQKAGLDRIYVPLPEGVNFLAAEGDGVRDWDLVGKPTDATGRRARIHFHYDLEGTHVVNLRAELPFGDAEQVSVPALLVAWDKAAAVAAAEASQTGKPEPKAGNGPPELVERQRGTVALSAEPRTEIRVSRAQNLTPVDVRELPQRPGPHGAPLFGMRWARVPWALSVSVATHDDLAVLVAAIDHAHFEAIALEDGRVLTKAYLDVRNNSRQYLKVRLPKGAKVWSVFRSERPVKPATDAEGTLRVPLAKAGEGAPFTIELAWFLEQPAFGPGGAREIGLPRFDLPASYCSAQLYLPRRYRHYNFDGGLKRVEALSQGFRFRGAGAEPAADGLSQAVAPGSAAEGDGAGQLPIRIPMLRRGLEARFERTLVVDEPLSLKWECKRRKSDVL